MSLPEPATRHRFALIAAEIPRLRRYAQAVSPSRDEADELVQDTLMRAVAKIALWRDGTNMRAWLFTILQRQRITRLRKAMRRPDFQLFDEEATMLSSPANQVESVQLTEVERAIAQLPPEQAEVLRLVVLQSLTYEETADILGCAVGTVRSRLSRARVRLGRLLSLPEEGLDAAA